MEYDFAFHNSHITQYRSPFGAIPIGTKVNLKILTDKGVDAYLNIINFEDKESAIRMNWEGDSGGRTLFSVKLDTSEYLGVNKYFFSLYKDGRTFYYGNNEEVLGGEGKIYYDNPKPYQITVFEESYIPEWYQKGVIYQIFVDRFYNGNKDGRVNHKKTNSFIYSNWYDEPMYIKDDRGQMLRWDFYGGNLKGVIDKLPYLHKLGITILYFNPIFESVSCHKYDVGDYEKIDPMYGDENIFKELCSKAKSYGMKVILDGVFSHTGADSKYFNKYGNYNTVGAYQSRNSEYFNWYRFNNYPDDYESWWGFNNQPNVDELNPTYLNYIVTGTKSIVAKWLELGASGWRLDVADELPDEFIELLKSKMRETKKNSVLIGEVWEDASNKISYSHKRKYFFGRELDSVTNYPLRDYIIRYVKGEFNSTQFVNRVYSLFENYPRENFYSTMNLLGNHDTVRIFSELGENKILLEFAVLIQMVFPGVPLIYYGDEAGMKGYGDPNNRKPYPWGKEDKDIYHIYSKFIKLRKNNMYLLKGDFSIREEVEGIVIIKRMLINKSLLIILNNLDYLKEVSLKKSPGKRFMDIINGRILSRGEDEKFHLEVKGKGYRIIEEL